MGSETRVAGSTYSVLVVAGEERAGPRPAGCDCANPPPFPGAEGAWGVSVTCPVHGDGEDDDTEDPVVPFVPGGFDDAGFYIASRTRHAERWRKLRDEGALIISTWIDTPVGVAGDDAAMLWSANVVQAAQATVCLVYVEPEDAADLKDVLVEVGAALGADVQVMVDCDDATWPRLGTWTFHPLVTHTPGAVAMLERLVAGRPTAGASVLTIQATAAPSGPLPEGLSITVDPLATVTVTASGLDGRPMQQPKDLPASPATPALDVDRFAFGSPSWPGLAKLTEEMGEVQQVLGKLLQTRGERHHWDGSDLKVRLEEELGDLTAAIQFFQRHNPLVEQAIRTRAARKLALFESWHSDPDANRVRPAAQASAPTIPFSVHGHLREFYEDTAPQITVMAGAQTGKSASMLAPEPSAPTIPPCGCTAGAEESWSCDKGNIPGVCTRRGPCGCACHAGKAKPS